MRRFILAFFAVFGVSSTLQAEPLELYIDADYSVSYAAAEAIELGVRTALEEVDYRLAGEPITVVQRDHRGNVKRSRRTMEDFLASNQALAIIGGLHSPPYIANQEFVNSHQVLMLLPWSAGGVITRPQSGTENWFFRLSIDDRKSGEFFVRETVERRGCRSVALVLLDTVWGRGGERAMTAALQARRMKAATIVYFDFTVGKAVAGTIAETVVESGADCAVLMANATNGATMINAMYEQAPDLRVFSHWGIMGGDFTQNVSHQIRQDLEIKVLQTCGLRVEAEGSDLLDRVLRQAVPEAEHLSEVGAITGFIHGYDLARILIVAAEQAAQTPDWNGSIGQRRAALKAALEDLQTPVEGLLKRYDRPFRPWHPMDPDAHEALGLDDLCMARFTLEGLLEHASEGN